MRGMFRNQSKSSVGLELFGTEWAIRTHRKLEISIVSLYFMPRKSAFRWLRRINLHKN